MKKVILQLESSKAVRKSNPISTTTTDLISLDEEKPKKVFHEEHEGGKQVHGLQV